MITAIMIFFTVYADETGTCGDNLTWKFEDATGTLTISGTGSMNYYTHDSYSYTPVNTPWYYYHDEINKIIVSDGVTSIGSYAFAELNALTSVDIAESVYYINWGGFYGCSNLISINLPDKISSIGSSAFYNCGSLKTINIPEEVTSISDYVFSGCSSLASIVISGKTKSIGESAFSDCKSIKSIVIPETVTSIGNNAFRSCSSLIAINIPENITSIGEGVFSGCNSLASIVLPEKLLSIGKWAFSGCVNLASINIPKRVTYIGDMAFYKCSGLTSLSISDKVTSIGGGAFYGCNLMTINVEASTPPYAWYGDYCGAYGPTFSDYNATLYVPDNAVESYQTKEPWSYFGNIKSVSEEYIVDVIEKCDRPSVSYSEGKLMFSCDTEGVEFVSNIADADIGNYSGNTIELSVAYNITVFAKKTGYENSDITSATICWIDAEDSYDGIINERKEIHSRVVLVRSNDGVITVDGVADNTKVSIYTLSGDFIRSMFSSNGKVSIDSELTSGSIAIVKIGEKSVKIVVE